MNQPVGKVTREKLFKLRPPKRGPLKKTLFSLLKRPLERLLCFGALNRYYQRVQDAPEGGDFSTKVLDALNISFELSEEERDRIPREGPCVVVANHPLGAVDGIILLSMLRAVRPDVKLMTNFVIGVIPELAETAIYADPFGSSSSVRSNIQTMRESIQWVKQGHVLAVFPAGEVSHITWRRPVVTDPEWTATVAGIVRKSGAPVLPVFFEGMNSIMFQVMGLIHPRLRTVLLPREAMKKVDHTFRVRVGKPISARKIKSMDDNDELASFLRLKTYVLGKRKDEEQEGPREDEGADREQEPIVKAQPADVIVSDVAALPKECLLLQSGEFQVWYGSADQLPHILPEIGRLREITFREVGEGTGLKTDIDEYDRTYLHLFVWNREKQEVVGAYRLGQTDTILRKQGREGLYTSTLFKFNRKLLEQINPALELGRSFVRREYQRHHAPLLLLWKGIATYIARHPQYRRLFGPVSISDDYDNLSRRLMVMFLKESRYLRDLAKLVKPRSPVKRRLRLGLDKKAFRTVAEDGDVEDLNSIISDIESDEKGVPILLKHYLRLQGHVLGFNVDEKFGDVIDGLILVDLVETDRKVLVRYMGEEGLRSFLAWHGVDMDAEEDGGCEGPGRGRSSAEE